jgi:hypothetical protein
VRTALRLKLHAQSCLEAVDAMTGHQFEFYYARLLECLGWTRIQVTGEKSGGDGTNYKKTRDMSPHPRGAKYPTLVFRAPGSQAAQECATGASTSS